MLKTFVAVAALLASTAASAETYAIQAGRLIVDAAQGARGASTVIVDNGRIARIENGFVAPEGAIVVDQRDKTVMPGMTDVHVHLTGTSGQPWYNGFTKKYSNPYRATVGRFESALTFSYQNSTLFIIRRRPRRSIARVEPPASMIWRNCNSSSVPFPK